MTFIDKKRKDCRVILWPGLIEVMRKLFCILSVIILFCAACSTPFSEKKKTDANGTNGEEVPIYEKKSIAYSFDEAANPYMMDYTEDGFYYFKMEQGGAFDDAYVFYYQAYEQTQPAVFCTVTEGLVKSFSGFQKEGKRRLAVLCIGDDASILVYDENGKQSENIRIDWLLDQEEPIVKMAVDTAGGYMIGKKDQVFYINAQGHIAKTIQLEKEIKKLFFLEDGRLFAYVNEISGSQVQPYLMELDLQNNAVKNTWELNDKTMTLYAFADGFLSVTGEKGIFFHAGREDERTLVDFGIQLLLASQIQYVFGTHDKMKMVLMDTSALSEGIRLVMLSTKGFKEDPQETKSSENNMLDGRRIVHVAIPEDCYYQVEFHAKKYNQISDTVFVDVVRFRGTLEDYLGKGNRPDIIMFEDHTEIGYYVKKGLLVDLVPMFQKQEKYALDDVIRNASDLFGDENQSGIYAMAAWFRLLLRTSNGTEYDATGKCNTLDYWGWYDSYLTENGISDVGNMEEILYANMTAFYDEQTRAATFTSDAFKHFMNAYRDLYVHRGGSARQTENFDVDYGCRQIAEGPKWYGGYALRQMADPAITMEGMPAWDGEDLVYMRVVYPMSILCTSDCQAEAFDFIMYFNTLTELLFKGYSEKEYGMDGGVTNGIFSLYQKNLDSSIYETDLPYASMIDRDRDGTPIEGTEREYFFTDEQKEHIRQMIEKAIPEKKSQRVIYAMVLEEMEAFLQGKKDLDSACEILQNRATLYLCE